MAWVNSRRKGRGQLSFTHEKKARGKGSDERGDRKHINRAVRTQWREVREDRNLLIVNRDRGWAEVSRVKAAWGHCPLGSKKRGCN